MKKLHILLAILPSFGLLADNHPQPPVPGAHNQHGPDHEEVVGEIIAVDVENEVVRVMTKEGPVVLKVTPDSELLLPNEAPEPLMDVNPEEAKGKMVRIASRDGKIDHIEPAGGPVHHPGPGHHPGPVPHGEHGPEHGHEIVGTVIGVDEENGLLRIMTKEGPVAFEVTPDSELLLPNEEPEALVDIEPEEFEQEAKGKMVRIMVRDNQIDHIMPAAGPGGPHHPVPGQPPHTGPGPHHPPVPGQPPHTGPGPHPPVPGQPPHTGPGPHPPVPGQPPHTGPGPHPPVPGQPPHTGPGPHPPVPGQPPHPPVPGNP